MGDHLRANGHLPAAAAGAYAFGKTREELEPILVAAREHLAEEPGALEVDLRLPDGRRIAGRVGEIRSGVVGRAQAGRLHGRHRLAFGIEVAAASAAGAVRSGLLVGAGARGEAELYEVRAPSEPRRWLAELVALRDLGMRSPLPFHADPGWEFVRPRRPRDKDSPRQRAHKAWVSLLEGDGSGRAPDPEARQAFAGAPFPMEEGAYDPDFTELARIIMRPLLPEGDG